MLPLMLAAMPAAPSAAGTAEPAGKAAPAEAKGWVARPVLLTNASPHRLMCQAELAHWFSHTMATLDTQRMARLELWFDPSSGTHALRGPGGEFIPVEALWCGVSGRAYPTRGLVPLLRDRTARPAAVSITCRSESEGIACSPS